jgi:hypothetical protein
VVSDLAWRAVMAPASGRGGVRWCRRWADVPDDG